jgi:branched-chain amino acid transport system substrate-binding protein
MVAPLTGEYRGNGKEMREGIQLYVDELNRKGGLHGKKVKLIIRDDKNDPKRAAEIAQEFAENTKVLLVLGHYSSAASAKAGEQYKKFGLPAITSSVTTKEVTSQNNWYFATTVSNSVQAELLATYLNKILKHDKVLLIGEKGNVWAESVAESFIKACEELSFDLQKVWYFHPDKGKIEAERQLDDIINEIWTTDDWADNANPTAIFIAAGSSYGADIVSSLRYKNKRFTLVGADSFSTKNFIDQLKKNPVEQIEPGYYSDGLYTVSPLALEVSGREEQEFTELYKQKYDKEPSWVATGYYDAARIGIEAINQINVKGDLENDRGKIRGKLQERIYNLEKSEARFTTVSQYQQQQLEPVWKQLQLLFEKTNKEELNKAVNQERAFVIGEQHYAVTNLVYTGMKINSLENIDLKTGVFTMDFYLWFKSQRNVDFEPAEIEFTNAVTPIHFVTEPDTVSKKMKMAEGVLVPEQGDDKSKYRLYHIKEKDEKKDEGIPEMQKGILLDERTDDNNVTSRLYRIKGEFETDFLPEYRRAGRYILGTNFHHKALTRKYLVYIADTEGMKPKKKGKKLTDYLKDEEVLDTDSGWTIADTLFFQDTASSELLSDIRYVDRSLEPNSRFNAVVRIKDYELTLRGVIATISEKIETGNAGFLISDYIPILTLIFFSLSVLLLYLEKIDGIKFYNFIWFFQTSFGIIALLALQISVIQQFEKIRFWDRQYQEYIMVFFDILWWFVPAVFIHSALENMVWRTFENKAERRVPRIARLLAAILVYLLASFGVIAFVFDQKLTGLLATSALVSMIIGLAIQMNISNVFSGIAISIERPFRIGDWVKIGDQEGKVIDMTWRTTRILTRSGNILGIPNTLASESVVENYSYPNDRYGLSLRLETIPVGNPNAVRKLLLQATQSVKNVLLDPSPFVEFQGQGDSSAIFKVHFHVRNYEKKVRYLDEVWESVWKHLNTEGLELATPCRFIYNLEGQEPDWSPAENTLEKL